MENALLIGLSRQMVLERQMDVVANNIANVNTNGFKADKSLFEEYLKSGAHEDNSWAPTAASAMSRIAAPIATSRRARRADQQSAGYRDQRRRLLRGADRRRRALHPRRRSADQQPGSARHRSRQSGARHQRPDRVPADRSRHQRSPPTAPSPWSKAPAARDSLRGKLRLVSFADAQKLLKEGANLYSAGAGDAAQPDTEIDGAAGLHRKVQRQFGRRR